MDSRSPTTDTSDAAKLFDTLSSPRRILVINALRTADSTYLSLGELARRVTVAEVAPRSGCDRDYQRVYTALYQVHIPVLAERGVVEYDAESGVVTRGELFGCVVFALSAVWTSDGSAPTGDWELPTPIESSRLKFPRHD